MRIVRVMPVVGAKRTTARVDREIAIVRGTRIAREMRIA